MPIKVRALEKGYGGLPTHRIREEGEIFEVPDGSKDSWYEPVGKSGSARSQKAAPAVETDDGEELA